jgi:uncharacterized protein (TIGR03437 family)
VEQMGPPAGATAGFGTDGKLPLELGGSRVLIDGEPAPLLYAGPNQINVQTPFELAGKRKVSVQTFYRGVPSGKAEVEVAEAAPELFADPYTRVLVAANQDGRRNAPGSPAAAGSVVVLYGTGGGPGEGALVTGTAATGNIESGVLRLPVNVTVEGQEAFVLYAGYAPGLVGVVQMNVLLPPGLGTFRRMAPVVWRVGPHSSRAGGLLWVGQ